MARMKDSCTTSCGVMVVARQPSRQVVGGIQMGHGQRLEALAVLVIAHRESSCSLLTRGSAVLFQTHRTSGDKPWLDDVPIRGRKVHESLSRCANARMESIGCRIALAVCANGCAQAPKGLHFRRSTGSCSRRASTSSCRGVSSVSSTKALKSCNPNLESINRSFVPLLTALSVEDRMGKAVIPEPDRKHWQSRWHSSASEFPDGCSGLTYEAHRPDASGTRRAVSLQLHHPEESK